MVDITETAIEKIVGLMMEEGITPVLYNCIQLRNLKRLSTVRSMGDAADRLVFSHALVEPGPDDACPRGRHAASSEAAARLQ